MTINIPELALVVLVGPSGAGKSTFARRHFKPTEVLSSDACRGLVSDDENDQAATDDAFDVLYYVAAKRLARGLLTVVDATNVQPDARKPLIQLAREHHVIPVALVFNLPTKLCVERNESRPERDFGARVVARQAATLKRSLRSLKREGFRHITTFKSPDDVEATAIERTRLWNDKKDDHGPFDLIGDVHGCFDELVTLLTKLGYAVDPNPAAPAAHHPEGRKAVFLGDLVDRGPKSPAVLRLAMSMVESGTAYCVPGNHDVKLLRKLRGRKVSVTHGLEKTLEQLENESGEFKTRVQHFIDGLVSHLVFDDGNLVAAHAGLKEAFQGRGSGKVRDFCLYGETTGETDSFGLPVRYDWAAEYRGRAMVAYGHTPVPNADWVNRTICIDTGCVFGGRLTALRYPEKELVHVDARRVYYEPAKPLDADAESPTTTERPCRDLLDITDVQGKRVIETRLHHRVTIREENSIAALEVMSRFAVDPHWLIYLPPTMSPCETAPDGPHLEHPREAFAHYRKHGITSVICEEKHMGSRAIVVVCRDADAAKRRFGSPDDRMGVVTTRTGRPFFKDDSLEREFLGRVEGAATRARFWERFDTDWLCLDTELMPWSAKAQELLRDQYAAVGAAAGASLGAAVGALERAARRLPEVAALAALRDRFAERRAAASAFVDAYRQYCWPVTELSDFALAPFHLLATEGHVHTDQTHEWHMTTLAELCAADEGLFRATPFHVVDLDDPDTEAAATHWWEELTANGGEGMVVKPLEWNARGKKGLAQPAIKCRGREYLRIIYGPEYTRGDQLEKLRSRHLATKRSLAVREYALGIEALTRFVEGEPLYRVHECVFGVLALESEGVDPRL